MNEQEVREFEENIVKGANIAFQRLVNQKKKEDGELVFSRNGHIFRVKAVDLDKIYYVIDIHIQKEETYLSGICLLFLAL